MHVCLATLSRRDFVSCKCVTSCFHSSSPPPKKGFSISSLPSIGLISVRSVPLATTNPNALVSSTPSSSVSHISPCISLPRPYSRKEHTAQTLHNLIQHQIHQLIKSFQRADHYIPHTLALSHNASSLPCPSPFPYTFNTC
jgi:hypothetical protein